MKIVTLASRHTFSLWFLRFRTGIAFEFVSLGRGETWTSFQLKLSNLYDFSKQEIAAGRGEEPFLFVDAFDVIVANVDPRYYMSLYRGKPLFAAEMYNWPDKNFEYPEENFKHRQPYLNSGCLIATPNDIYRLLQDNEFRHYTNDQLYWSHVYVKNPNAIDLDFDSKMCACLVAYFKDAHALQKSGNDLVFLEAFKNPAVLHFNGPAHIKKLMWRWYGHFMLLTIKARLKKIGSKIL
jgi:hypothetical protein